MLKKIKFLLIVLLFVNTAISQSNDETAIKGILNMQTIAWNAGNIESFMQGYWQSDSLKFIGKSGITYGWQRTLDNYKKNYPDATAMGKLDFTIVDTKKLSALYYFVVGKWHLARTTGDIGGYFTLLFKKIKNNWLIVVDHSS
jgi:hypothetical protein